MDPTRIYNPKDIRKSFQRNTFLLYIAALMITIALAMVTNIRQGYTSQALIQSIIIILLGSTSAYGYFKRSYDIPTYFAVILTAIMLLINTKAFLYLDPGPLIGLGALPFFVGLITINKYDHLILNIGLILIIIIANLVGYIDIPLAWQMKLYAIMGIGTAAVSFQRNNSKKLDVSIIKNLKESEETRRKLEKSQNLLTQTKQKIEEMKANIQPYFSQMSNSTNANLFEMIAEYTYDWEILLYPDRSIAWTNIAVQRVTGYTKEDFVKLENYTEVLIQPNQQKLFKDLLDIIFETKKAFNDQVFQINHRNGTQSWVAISGQPSYFSNGKFAGARLSVRTTTERRSQEQRLQTRKDELEKLNKIMVGREKMMIELKQKVKDLEQKLADTRVQNQQAQTPQKNENQTS